MLSYNIKKNIPNTLSILRIFLAIFFILLLFKKNFSAAAGVFAFAAITDFLDGFWARKWHVTSELGAIIDPLADKFLITLAYLSLFHMDFIPGYVCAIVLGRDIAIVLGVLLCKIHRVELKIAPLKSSKINTATQLIYVFFVIVCNLLSTNIPLTWEMPICSLIVSLSTTVSGFDYVLKYYWIKDAILKNKR
ncbi:MAG: CDP-alcohol phosphatidyltransferase family protein [Holosporaceae bacterium]|jgi:CDP-diacylglycerol--glycerol-3-phosphate 3-phosphatidyltransferase|nr:CDP-alcohol phosphatidyltransferase family protein [Holosporaceae bacterium]